VILVASMIRGGLFKGAIGRLLTSLAVRGADVDARASLSTATSARRALEDIIPTFPKENEKRQPAGP
jgi:hypothetical protein